MEAIGGPADPIIEPARADRDAAGHAGARRERPRILQIDHRLGNQAGVDLQALARFEGAQRGVRYFAEACLDGRAVRHESCDGFADRPRDRIISSSQ